MGLAGLWALAGCAGNLPEPDCQIRAGSISAEGGYDPFIASEGVGAAASRVGTEEACRGFKTFARGVGGSEVCHDGGDPEYCAQARQAQPITVTPMQLREMIVP